MPAQKHVEATVLRPLPQVVFDVYLPPPSKAAAVIIHHWKMADHHAAFAVFARPLKHRFQTLPGVIRQPSRRFPRRHRRRRVDHDEADIAEHALRWEGVTSETVQLQTCPFERRPTPLMADVCVMVPRHIRSVPPTASEPPTPSRTPTAPRCSPNPPCRRRRPA